MVHYIGLKFKWQFCVHASQYNVYQRRRRRGARAMPR
jgi:hypothetical protein